jgi:hypothetical protein
MEKKLANVQQAMYPLVAPAGYAEWCIFFFADGSLIEDCAGFAVH